MKKEKKVGFFLFYPLSGWRGGGSELKYFMPSLNTTYIVHILLFQGLWICQSQRIIYQEQTLLVSGSIHSTG